MRDTRQPAQIKRRASAVDDVDDVSDSYHSQRVSASSRRYVDTRGNQVIQQGNQRIMLHPDRCHRLPRRYNCQHQIGQSVPAGLHDLWTEQVRGAVTVI